MKDIDNDINLKLKWMKYEERDLLVIRTLIIDRIKKWIYRMDLEKIVEKVGNNIIILLYNNNKEMLYISKLLYDYKLDNITIYRPTRR